MRTLDDNHTVVPPPSPSSPLPDGSLSRVKAALFGALAGLLAAAVGGPTTIFVGVAFELVQGGAQGTNDDGLFPFGLIFILFLSFFYAVIVAGIPAAILGAALGAVIHRRPIDRPTLLAICLVGNLGAAALFASWLTNITDYRAEGILFIFVVCTISSLAAAWAFHQIRRRATGIS